MNLPAAKWTWSRRRTWNSGTHQVREGFPPSASRWFPKIRLVGVRQRQVRAEGRPVGQRPQPVQPVRGAVATNLAPSPTHSLSPSPRRITSSAPSANTTRTGPRGHKAATCLARTGIQRQRPVRPAPKYPPRHRTQCRVRAHAPKPPRPTGVEYENTRHEGKPHGRGPRPAAARPKADPANTYDGLFGGLEVFRCPALTLAQFRVNVLPLESESHACHSRQDLQHRAAPPRRLGLPTHRYAVRGGPWAHPPVLRQRPGAWRPSPARYQPSETEEDPAIGITSSGTMGR